jgi:hypothetical protein
VRVTHRFHPLFGQDFEFVAHRQNWGEDLCVPKISSTALASRVALHAVRP